MAPPAWVIERAATCHGCDRLFRPTWTCKECGCFMKIKTRVHTASCPLGKWDSRPHDDTYHPVTP